MTLHQQLAAFDRLRGRDPIDGSMILGPEGPAPPDLPMEQFGGVTGQPEDPFGIHDDPLPAAELIPRRSPADPRGPASAPVEAPGEPAEALTGAGAAPASLSPDFLVMGATADAPHVAVCGGREVVLNDVERARVRRTVLQAIARSVRDQLREIESLLPKRRRASKSPAPTRTRRATK